MKLTTVIFVIISLISCKDSVKINKKIRESTFNKVNTKLIIKKGDTVLIKQPYKLDEYNTTKAKSRSYFWVTASDTLDFKITVKKYITDTIIKPFISIKITHQKKIFFNDAIKKLKKSIPTLQKDFNLKNLGAIQFEGTYAYKDFNTSIQKEYLIKYGKEKINTTELDNFLKQSSINTKLKKLLNSLNKKKYEYYIEKFMLHNSTISGICILVRIKNTEI